MAIQTEGCCRTTEMWNGGFMSFGPWNRTSRISQGVFTTPQFDGRDRERPSGIGDFFLPVRRDPRPMPDRSWHRALRLGGWRRETLEASQLRAAARHFPRLFHDFARWSGMPQSGSAPGRGGRSVPWAGIRGSLGRLSSSAVRPNSTPGATCKELVSPRRFIVAARCASRAAAWSNSLNFSPSPSPDRPKVSSPNKPFIAKYLLAIEGVGARSMQHVVVSSLGWPAGDQVGNAAPDFCAVAQCPITPQPWYGWRRRGCSGTATLFSPGIRQLFD
ncbi:hypothetical protein GGR00_004964 [Aminobacter aganoensis]|uniref:Uncharacterized protein n=1 Tax=Aminobacter aganoensis TaxID=83264 RepID=A0A7X0FCD3_9HYPH|nr:hypothetical protein [Aminobacter aganoensis]